MLLGDAKKTCDALLSKLKDEYVKAGWCSSHVSGLVMWGLCMRTVAIIR
jgi:hypothetical protein